MKPRKSRSSSASTRFLFLTIGFKPPTQSEMAAWGKWFKSLGDRIVDQGGLWRGGREFSSDGVKDLPFEEGSTTGYLIFEAKNLAEAEKLAKRCPIVSSNQLYEIVTK